MTIFTIQDIVLQKKKTLQNKIMFYENVLYVCIKNIGKNYLSVLNNKLI